MIIRPADIDDAHAIATIHVRSWQYAYADILPREGLANLSIEQRTQRWAGWLQAESNPMRVLVAEVDDRVVGFASWGPHEEGDADPDSVMLYSIYLLPDSMHMGIGSQLLEAVEVDMIASGARHATLEVLKDNSSTRQFYERHGWEFEPDSESEQTFFDMDMITVRYRKSFG